MTSAIQTESLPTDFYSLRAQRIDGVEVAMETFRGTVVLIVNVASHCVLTTQYAPLQALYERYAARGFTILGFPCNQFGSQEPEGNEEIQQFCSLKYNVTFPMFAKIEVNGERTHPIYEFLKPRAPGFLGSESIKWNFTKFLISRDGKVVARFAPQTGTSSMEQAIERELNRQSNEIITTNGESS